MNKKRLLTLGVILTINLVASHHGYCWDFPSSSENIAKPLTKGVKVLMGAAHEFGDENPLGNQAGTNGSDIHRYIFGRQGGAQAYRSMKATHGYIRKKFQIRREDSTHPNTFPITIDKSGIVYFGIEWVGIDKMMVELVGPRGSRIGKYERVSGKSKMGFSIRISPELIKKGGKIWKLNFICFKKSHHTITGKIHMMYPIISQLTNTTVSTTSNTSNNQSSGNSSKQVARLRSLEVQNRQLKSRIERLERKDKVFTTQLTEYLKLIKRLKARINALDHKDDGSRRG